MYIQRWGIFLYHMRTKEWNAHMRHAIAKLVISRQIQQVWEYDFEYNTVYKHRQQSWQSGHRKYIHLYNNLTMR
jgi:RecA-family ATPase